MDVDFTTEIVGFIGQVYRAAGPFIADVQVGFSCKLEIDRQRTGTATETPGSIVGCECGFFRSIARITPGTDVETIADSRAC